MIWKLLKAWLSSLGKAVPRSAVVPEDRQHRCNTTVRQDSHLIITVVMDKGYLSPNASGLDNSIVVSAFISVAYP
ncbi:hypothetical protein ACFX12_025618 [Malus domestica]